MGSSTCLGVVVYVGWNASACVRVVFEWGLSCCQCYRCPVWVRIVVCACMLSLWLGAVSGGSGARLWVVLGLRFQLVSFMEGKG